MTISKSDYVKSQMLSTYRTGRIVYNLDGYGDSRSSGPEYPSNHPNKLFVAQRLK